MFSFFFNKSSRNSYNEFMKYPCPRSMTYFWNFGALSFLFLIVQIVSGLFLTFYYEPNVLHAFDSIEYLMREVNSGWFIRAMHTTGASFFFFFLYLHFLRGFNYRLYTYPRTRVWFFGLVASFLLMLSAFLGYVLPWGQMSYWAATVITKLVTSLPYFGGDLLYWIWGSFSLNNATLSRIFTLHFMIPFFFIGFVLIHILLLHGTGSSVELGLTPNLVKEIHKANAKGTPFFFRFNYFTLVYSRYLSIIIPGFCFCFWCFPVSILEAEGPEPETESTPHPTANGKPVATTTWYWYHYVLVGVGVFALCGIGYVVYNNVDLTNTFMVETLDLDEKNSTIGELCGRSFSGNVSTLSSVKLFTEYTGFSFTDSFSKLKPALEISLLFVDITNADKLLHIYIKAAHENNINLANSKEFSYFLRAYLEDILEK